MGEIRRPGIPLQEWINLNIARDETFWKGPVGHQVRFVRNRLLPLFGTGLDFDQMAQAATVISTHRSKSTELPVYQLARSDQDLQIVLRNNFHDWKMSVLSATSIQPDFSGLFHMTPPIEPDYTGNLLSSAYFEGFPQDLVFPYYSQTDGRRWSAEMHSDEALWTSVFLMMRSLGHIRSLVWQTRESNQREVGHRDDK